MGAEVGFLAVAFAGFLSFLSPCVLPLVPPYLCFIAGTSFDDLAASDRGTAVTRQALVRALAFVLGFSAVFIALGASASVLGRMVGDNLALLTHVAGVVIVLLGLHMLGVFRSFLLTREARFQIGRRPASLGGALVVGAAFAFGWTPCVGPVLASVLMVAGVNESVGAGAGLLAAYAAGLGVPFLLAALFTGHFMRWSAGVRRHLGVIEKTLGVALVATGIVVFLGAMPAVAGWLLEAAPFLGRIG